jgi:hypothetical protein
MDKAILAPAAILVAWTLVMLTWMAVTRFPAIAKSGIDMKATKPGGRGQNLDGVLPDIVQWKSHNYTHLHEQPTIFYAVIFILWAAHAVTPMLVILAWGYVILRILHSLWQATVNTIMPVRFGLFLLSTICLVILTIRALISVF